MSRPSEPIPYDFTPAEPGVAVSLGAGPVVELPGELEAPESAGAFAAGVSSGVSPTPDADGVVVAEGVPSVVVEPAADVDDVPAELLLLSLLLETALAANPVFIVRFGWYTHARAINMGLTDSFLVHVENAVDVLQKHIPN